MSTNYPIKVEIESSLKITLHTAAGLKTIELTVEEAGYLHSELTRLLLPQPYVLPAGGPYAPPPPVTMPYVPYFTLQETVTSTGNPSNQ